MELSDQVIISAPRDRVWAALNDPAVLARCIDGVESLDRVETETGSRFEGRMNARVGPVRATFAGHVTLTQVVPPESYVLVGEGKGGVAGFAKGQATVHLAELASGATELRYTVQSSVGGKLAQLGARLIEGTAKGLATSFFTKLQAEVEVPPEASAPPTPLSESEAPSPSAPLPEQGDEDGAQRPQAGAEIPSGPAITPPEAPSTGLSPTLWGGGLILAVAAFLLWQWN